MIDVKNIFYDSLRMYFAPLVGAFKAINDAMKRLEQKHRNA